MIKAQHLSYSYPQKDLFHDITFTLEDGQHCAFIGVSGSGKSTLADIIMDPEKYMYTGDLEIMPNCQIGYVNQFADMTQLQDMTVFDYIAQDFIKFQNKIAAICTKMETAEDLDTLLEHYQHTLDAYEAIGGDDFESIIDKKLYLADLTKLRDLSVLTLSGGEFKLVQIIKEMLSRPSLLIMDEPDVFLDFENLNSLKSLINSHKGTLLVITHNRYLLNNCFNKILHLENMELQEFDGSYIEYNYSLLERKIELQELAHKDTEEIKRNEELIDRLRTAATNYDDASRGKSLKARIKIQERLEARRIKAPFVEIKQPNIVLSTNKPIESETALTVNGYHVAFEHPLLENVCFEIGATDKVALIGANGTGKTTLLRDLYKKQHPSIHVNENIEMAYVSQLQGETLDETSTIMDTFLELGFETPADVLAYLSEYGFHEDMMQQKISSLSGGEKNLLQLAIISLGEANMLLLDEPTSHLDTYAQLALEEAIKNYNGAILMISHDFYSIANCMDYVLIIEDQTIRRMSMRKFRKMIYARHFDKDYLEIEQKKKEIELKIARALKDNNFTLAESLFETLEPLVKSLSN
ncbi:MAG: ABC-F family ATP-binding cassette domain-containing protein [Cellulosilyticum sp.]|nr:ABC-F family ATP-binding cassette domain-containing protein [Cellulosilyticum sp.]